MWNKAKAAINFSDTIRSEYFFANHVHTSLFLTVSPAGKLIHNPTATSAKKATGTLFRPKIAAKMPACDSHKPCGWYCGRWVIHVFLIIYTQSMPAAILGLAVGLFPFIGSAVASLSFTVTFSSAG